MLKFASGAKLALGWREFWVVSSRGAKTLFVSRAAEFASCVLSRALALALVFCVLSLLALLVGSALGGVVVLYRIRRIMVGIIEVNDKPNKLVSLCSSQLVGRTLL